MEWYVYRFDMNRQKIVKFNVFDHWSFVKYVKQHIKKYKNKDEFAERLKSEVYYYFWSKAEWELVIEITEDNRIFLKPWVGCRNPEEVKIEINPVVTEDGFNWLKFVRLHTERQMYKNKAKIDVYDQAMFEWDKFVDYVFRNGKKL